MFKRVVQCAVAVLLAGTLLHGSSVRAQDGGALPTWGELTPGTWNMISPGGATRCMYGDDYAFFVRPAVPDSDKLMIFFQGGGACWDGASCGDNDTFAFEYDVTPDEPVRFTTGIFDFDNPANPVGDYNTVFVAYCSGDVFSGAAEVTFTEPEPLTVYFDGWQNTQAVLDWTFANAPEPSQVFLTGASAGGYGATLHAAQIMARYDAVPVLHVSDGAVGVLPAGTNALELWNAAVSADAVLSEGYTPDTLMTDAIIALAGMYPDNLFAHYTTFTDVVQIAFYGYMSGYDLASGDEDLFRTVAGEWALATLLDLTRINAAADNFYLYLAGGTQHTVLLRPEFYTYTVKDVPVRDWLANLLAGEGESVKCNVLNGECLETPDAVDTPG